MSVCPLPTDGGGEGMMLAQPEIIGGSTSGSVVNGSLFDVTEGGSGYTDSLIPSLAVVVVETQQTVVMPCTRILLIPSTDIHHNLTLLLQVVKIC